MLKNYLVVALRNLRRHKGYAFINVFGLAAGLACALLITLYVQHERSYDRHYAHADRLYRLTTELELTGDYKHFARAASVAGQALQAADPSVEASARLLEADPIVQVGTEQFLRQRTFYADTSVFHVFSMPFVAGSAAQALGAPGQAVLTRSAAARYFGASSPVGETIYMGPRKAPFEVVGVVEDGPAASHLHYDVLVSMKNALPEEVPGPESWTSGVNYFTYVLLRPGARPAALERRLVELVQADIGESLRQFKARYRVHLQPITEIHLHSDLTAEAEPGGDVLYVYVFACVALIVLLIACINFTNLATAQALDRAREVGVRKSFGAARGQLVRQFLVESFGLTLVAFGLAIGLAWMLLPVFNDLTGRQLTFGDTLGAFGGLAAAVPIVALLAGAYPAFVLSSYVPTETMRGRFRSSRKGLVLRRALVVTQFTLSIVLVAGSFVVQRQLAYAQSQRVGFNREQVVILPLRPDEGIRAQEAAFKAAVLEGSSIAAASLTDQYPSGGSENNSMFIPAGKTDDAGVTLWFYTADFDLVQTLGMEMAEGRPFDPAMPTDSAAFLVNETAARLMGFTDLASAAAIEIVDAVGLERLTHPVVGVVRDFHLQSFHHTIRPLAMRVGGAGFRYDYLLVRVRPGNFDAALAHLRQTWTRFSSGTPFNLSFLDQEFDALYQSDQRLGRAFGYFTLLAILIACLGLLGLSAYATEQRRREIGVRKVLGASVPSIVALLSRDFVRPVLLAVLLATPLAYLAAVRWLDSFAFQMPLGPLPFVLAGGLALAVAILTTSFFTVRAATSDPVKTLHYE